MVAEAVPRSFNYKNCWSQYAFLGGFNQRSSRCPQSFAKFCPIPAEKRFLYARFLVSQSVPTSRFYPFSPGTFLGLFNFSLIAFSNASFLFPPETRGTPL